MTFLPIVDRELRVRARQPRTYRVRQRGALVAIVAAGILLTFSQLFATPGRLGSVLFGFLSWLAFLACLLEGPRTTADCLSEEKRAGTLGLLFLTDLKGHDVVLGKGIASSLNSFYALLAVFPPLAISLLLGGVTGGEFWRVVLALLNTLFLSLNTGMLVSAASRQERRAWTASVGILLFVAVVPPLLWWGPFRPAAWSAWFSPTAAFLGAADGAYKMNPQRYWHAQLGMQVLSWVFLFAASYILPRAWQDRPARAQASQAQRVSSPVDPVAEARRARERQRLLSLNPVAWLAGRHERELGCLWALVIAAGGTAVLAWLISQGAMPVALSFLPGAVALHFVLAVWVAFRASHMFAESRDSGALELLLATPLSVKDILDGYGLALKRQFFGPVVALLGVETMLLFAHAMTRTFESGKIDESVTAIIFVGIGMGLFVLDLYAAGLFGMWLGLRCKRPAQAFTQTVLYVLVLPLLGFFCWPVVGLVKNVCFISYGRDQLNQRFRAIVIERFAGEAETPGPVAVPGKKPVAKLPSVLGP